MRTPRRSRRRPLTPPTPLGVLEFTAALNVDDRNQILYRLREFAVRARYERILATTSSSGRVGAEVGNDADDGADDDEYDDDVDDGDDDHDELPLPSIDDFDVVDEERYASAKRTKFRHSNESVGVDGDDEAANLPSWAADTRDYGVPFVGTSIGGLAASSSSSSCSSSSSSHSHGMTNVIVPGMWPTGLLAEYRRRSPLGIELLGNEYLFDLYSNRHRRSSSALSSSAAPMAGKEHGKRRKNDTSIALAPFGTIATSSSSSGLDPRIAIALNYYHWTALHEWILGYVPHTVLLRELRMRRGGEGEGGSDGRGSRGRRDDGGGDGQGVGCPAPPPVMTTLMKRLLPEWARALRRHAREGVDVARRAREKGGMKRMACTREEKQRGDGPVEERRGHNTEDGGNAKGKDDPDDDEGGIVGGRRFDAEEILLLSSLRNLTALCHLSTGTAREVLRRLSIGTIDDEDGGGRTDGTSAAIRLSGSGTAAVARGGGAGGGGGGMGIGRRPGDGTSWMAHLFRSQPTRSSTSSYRSRIECLRLVCTLLETNEGAILSRLAEVPCPPPPPRSSSIGRRGGVGDNRNGRPVRSSSSSVAAAVAGKGGEFGLAHIALRYGMQSLLEIDEMDCRGKVEGDDDSRRQINSYACLMTRLLRDVREIILPPVMGGENTRRIDGGGDKKGGVFGIDAKVLIDLLFRLIENKSPIFSNVTFLVLT
jgi:hypothetical protein